MVVVDFVRKKFSQVLKDLPQFKVIQDQSKFYCFRPLFSFQAASPAFVPLFSFECCFVPRMDRTGFLSAYRQPLTYIICIYAPGSVRRLSPSHQISQPQDSQAGFLEPLSVCLNLHHQLIPFVQAAFKILIVAS
ncbi:hypothetical protein PCANC_28561 [Puccinia coronata f. sp. avenae]|uniref:Uncharacterized protein n=1 Tax=Puccinia coronata f. sp. avenae TaxID=200324 RepID=A0A2N5RUN4_9BASI|nr:hypothetical protein PCANC_28561 [Puccinia coronata f. sp. avenae]